MKVALKNIHPNPWRYINKGYPIDKAKVEKLRSSIQRTGFWDNLVGRKSKDGFIEIAYGHHRIEALRREFTPDHEIDVIVRDLDDVTMLKIMAAENDAMDVMSPAVINETVRAALDFLRGTGAEPSNSAVGIAKKFHIGIDVAAVCEFLDWPVRRVSEASAAINAIRSGDIDKEEYESLPTQAIAEIYRQQIKKTPLPKEKRTEILQKIKSHEIATRGVRQEILKAKFQNGNGRKDLVEIDDIAKTITSKILECTSIITPNFINNADAISAEAVLELSGALKYFHQKLVKLKGNLKKKNLLQIGG